MKKVLSLCIVLSSLVLILSGCGSADYDPQNYEDNYGDEYSNEDTDPEEPAPVIDDAELDGGDVIQTAAIPALENRKIIYTANLTMNAPDPEVVYNNILDDLSTYGAYVESSNIKFRTYSIKIRVLSDNFTDFVDAIKESGDVVSYVSTSEDITNAYSTFEARQAALEARHTRILELIETAADLDVLLQLEEERFDIETELNQVGQTLGEFDSLVDYSTINVTINRETEQEVVLPQTDTPAAVVTETYKFKSVVEVTNKEEEAVNIYVDLLLNGEFVRQYEGQAFEDGTAIFEISELDSDTEYQLRITTIAAEHRESNVVRRTFVTESTYMNEVGNVFEGSFNALVAIFEFLGLSIVAILPFAVTITIFVIPSRIVYNKYLRNFYISKKEAKIKEKAQKQAQYNQMRYQYEKEMHEKRQQTQKQTKKQGD